jgi:hypothetical protein
MAPQPGSTSVRGASFAAAPSPRAVTPVAPPMGTPSRLVAAALHAEVAPPPPHSVAPVAAPQVASSLATSPFYARATLRQLRPVAAVTPLTSASTPTPAPATDAPPASSVHSSRAAALVPSPYIAAPPPIRGKHGVTWSLFALNDDDHSEQSHRDAILRRARNSPRRRSPCPRRRSPSPRRRSPSPGR